MNNSTGPLVDRYPDDRTEGVKFQAVSTGLGFFPQSLAPAMPEAQPWSSCITGGRRDHLFESFARKCLEASRSLGWVLSWLLPLIL